MKKLPTIILASASPRRSELLKRMELPFEVIPVDVEEKMRPIRPSKLAKELSELKMKAFLKDYNSEFSDRWIISSDTFVNYRKKNLGKPNNREEAFSMISFLCGKRHTVYTGLTLYSPIEKKIKTKISKTSVRFSKLTNSQIEEYINSNEWKGVAGSYRIQEKGEMLIQKITGPYSNVMGLPLNLLWQMLSKAGYYNPVFFNK